MTENSRICSLISSNPEGWEDMLTKKYGIKIKRDGALAIFNYSYGCDFADPIVQEARGIIINTSTLEVVCWPFRKFGNHNEPYADEIDWSSARVLEKVDGSIIKLWYDGARGAWQFSTNGMIRAEEAHINNDELSPSFMDVIREADNLKDIPFDALDKALTYIFELVSPTTQVVVKYPTASLYHLGTRSNLTGEECERDIGIKKPASYAISTLGDCVAAALALNAGMDKDVCAEGFVVVDSQYRRIKVKSPEYLVMNRLTQMSDISKREALELIVAGSENIAVICEANPELVPMFKFYEYKLAELKLLANRMATLARGLFREYDGNRAAVAGVISSHRLSGIGFEALRDGRTGEEILMAMQAERFLRLIPDYECEDVRALLLKARK